MIISFSPDEEQLLNQIMDMLGKSHFELIERTEEAFIASSRMKFYPREQRIEIQSENLLLGRKQFALILLLARNPNRIFTKEEFYNYVWNDAVPVNVEETIRYHISDIRKKLYGLTGENFIETVWGIGYRFQEYKPV